MIPTPTLRINHLRRKAEAHAEPQVSPFGPFVFQLAKFLLRARQVEYMTEKRGRRGDKDVSLLAMLLMKKRHAAFIICPIPCA